MPPATQTDLCDLPDVLRPAQVAAVLGYGAKRFNEHDLQSLGIPYVKRGKRGVRVFKAALQRWMETTAGQVPG